MNKKTLSWCALLAPFLLTSQLTAQVLEEQIPGVLSNELWQGMAPGYDVNNLVVEQKFYAPADVVNTSYHGNVDLEDYDGGRMRGYITAPETGNYRFWVSAKASVQLWISTDETKYRKKLVAYMGAHSGGGTHGIRLNDSNRWDQYDTQMSEEIYLEAGQKYYIEALYKAGRWQQKHIHIAWAPPSGERGIWPREVLTSYAQEAQDQEDDSLPDSWEIQYGLDPEDNGFTDFQREGERGDFDGDGLNNREEYVLGLDPTNPDSDGDGLSDWDEVNTYNTNPGNSDAPDQVLHTQLNLSGFTSSTMDWVSTSRGYVASQFRGTTTWTFTVPQDGYWVLNLATRLLGELYLPENVDFTIAIDGRSALPIKQAYGKDAHGTIRHLTPYLTAGEHTVTLHIDNMIARRSVSLLSLDLLQPTGLDLDGDHIPDWINAEVAGKNQLFAYQSFSRTSPAFIEGVASDRAYTLVNGLPATLGVDHDHWYANVALDATGATAFNVDFSQERALAGSIQWIATNLFETDALTIRQGDSLKLTAFPLTGATGEPVTITAEAYNLAASPFAIATQSSTGFGGLAHRAIDGSRNGKYSNASITHSAGKFKDWWKVTLPNVSEIESVILWNRIDTTALTKRLSNYRLSILDEAGAVVASQDFHTGGTYSGRSETWTLPSPVAGKSIRVQLLGQNANGDKYLSLAEVEVMGNAINQTLPSDSSTFTYQFTDGRERLLTATHASGLSSTLTVDVKQARSSSPQDLVDNVVSQLAYSEDAVDADLALDGGNTLNLQEIAGTSNNLLASSTSRGTYSFLWRLYDGGPVVGKQEVNLIGFAGATQGGSMSSFLSKDFIGYANVVTPIVVTNLPPGGFVQVRIFRNGLTFADGTKTLVLSAADFNNGVAYVTFLNLIGQAAGICHYVTVYDRNGQAVTTR